MNEQNIEPYKFKKSGRKARECGRKGGIASGISKRVDKKLKTLANLILNAELKDDSELNFLKNEFNTLEAKQMTKGAKLLANIYYKANLESASVADTIRAFTLLRDTAEQKPSKEQVIAFDENNELIIDLGEEEDEDEMEAIYYDD